jgi:hypothetical protein
MFGDAASRLAASGRERGGARDVESPADDPDSINPVKLHFEVTVRYALE